MDFIFLRLSLLGDIREVNGCNEILYLVNIKKFQITRSLERKRTEFINRRIRTFTVRNVIFFVIFKNMSVVKNI